MSRGYWYTLFAIVGWLISCSVSAEEAKPDQAKSQGATQGAQDKTRPFSLPVRVIEYPEQSEADKRQQNESRQREVKDLAAQQSMADGTQDIVWLSKLQLFLASFGALALLYSLHLTREATKAAKDAIHLDNRPWLDFEVKVASDVDRNDTDNYPKGIGVDIQVVVTNYGKSPALGVRTTVTEVLPREWDFKDDLFFDGRREKIRNTYSAGHRQGFSVFPGKTVTNFERVIISPEAQNQSVRIASMDDTRKERSLMSQYIVSALYNSPTTNTALETSTIYRLHQTYDRNHLTSLHFFEEEQFKAIPKRKIRLLESGYKRTK